MIPVIWEMWGLYKIEAETLEEAKKKSFDLPLPDNKEYIEDSFRIDEDGIPLHNKVSIGFCPNCKNRNLLKTCKEMLAVLEKIDFEELPIKNDICFWNDWKQAVAEAERKEV